MSKRLSPATSFWLGQGLSMRASDALARRHVILAGRRRGECDDGSHIILRQAWELAQYEIDWLPVCEVAEDDANEHACPPDDRLAAADVWVGNDAIVIVHGVSYRLAAKAAGSAAVRRPL